MKKWILVLLLVASSTVFADRRRDAINEEDELFQLRNKLLMYRDNFDKIRVKRWQDKRNSVAKKEVFQEIWDEMRRDVEKLQTTKNQKEETLMRLQTQVADGEKQIEELELRMREFGVQIMDKMNEYSKELKTGYPENILVLRQNMDDLISDLENRNYFPTADLVSNLFNSQYKVFANNEKRSIDRQRMAMQGFAQQKPGMKEKQTTSMVAGWKIKLGGIYQGFASTESIDAAILAKTGRLDERAWQWVESILPEKRESLQKVGMAISAKKIEEPLLIPIDVQLRKAVGEGYSSAITSTFWKDLSEELKGAGFVIYGMGTLMILSLLILSDKIFLFFLRGKNPKKFSKEIFEALDKGDLKQALAIARQSEGSVQSVFKAVLKSAQKGKTRDDAESAAYEVILHETPAIEKNITTINIFAAAAPLLGLLGTVSGMVNLFAAITLHGTSDPKIMAAGIAEALLSTKWGLIVAIPLLLVYNWANNQAGGIISNMEKYSARLINILYGESSVQHPEDALPKYTMPEKGEVVKDV